MFFVVSHRANNKNTADSWIFVARHSKMNLFTNYLGEAFRCYSRRPPLIYCIFSLTYTFFFFKSDPLHRHILFKGGKKTFIIIINYWQDFFYLWSDPVPIPCKQFGNKLFFTWLFLYWYFVQIFMKFWLSYSISDTVHRLKRLSAWLYIHFSTKFSCENTPNEHKSWVYVFFVFNIEKKCI